LKRKEVEKATLRLFNEPIAKYHTLNYKTEMNSLKNQNINQTARV